MLGCHPRLASFCNLFWWIGGHGNKRTSYCGTDEIRGGDATPPLNNSVSKPRWRGRNEVARIGTSLFCWLKCVHWCFRVSPHTSPHTTTQVLATNGCHCCSGCSLEAVSCEFFIRPLVSVCVCGWVADGPQARSFLVQFGEVPLFFKDQKIEEDCRR